MADEHREQSGSGGSGLISRTIRVTPETLTRKAVDLDTNASDVMLLTTHMTEKALELTGRIWSGEAQSAFVTRFKTLQDTINQYTPLLQKHASNLKIIAGQYAAVETEAKDLSSGLPGNIF